VALIQDRKVLGGNNSSEVRVGLGGRLNIGAYPSLGYLLNEFGPSTKGNARTPEVYEDEKKLRAILAEERITLLLGYKVTKVNKGTPRTIESVVATDVDTARSWCAAPFSPTVRAMRRWVCWPVPSGAWGARPVRNTASRRHPTRRTA